MISLIATDLDGTLLMDTQTIHPENAEVLRAAMEKGVQFTIASGRSVLSCEDILAAHGIRGAHIVAANGAQIDLYDAAAGKRKRIRTRYLSHEAVVASVRVLHETGVPACLFTENNVIYTSELAMRYHASEMEYPFGFEAIQKALLSDILKVLCVQTGGDASFTNAKLALREVPGISLTRSYGDNFEVMPEGVNKGEAVLYLAGKLGIPKEQIAAFGDNDNDLEMLSLIPYGFAMGNADAHIQKRANHITKSNTEAGVAYALRTLLSL